MNFSSLQPKYQEEKAEEDESPNAHYLCSYTDCSAPGITGIYLLRSDSEASRIDCKFHQLGKHSNHNPPVAYARHSIRFFDLINCIRTRIDVSNLSKLNAQLKLMRTRMHRCANHK